ncbi:ABC transporter substrate-binding protein [Seongchinamella sediminis]|uniref:ABC transporter substrate-binding protein n=1 Tax=Seongchinamella sediminis TaxID=2283635 RepID=A0A3L7DZ69_9GAMM|nr:extracellular solute-binding protein [Seongchinamella sediminis]RLQ22554.1 ABC transporter substrate-binding protein [Seongchinamella sediminis]
MTAAIFHRLRTTCLGALCAGLLVACGGPDEAAPAQSAAPIDNTEEVQAYYAANPDFFGFKTPADLPAGLVWEDGSALSEMGSPAAKKGGTEYRALQDFPRTLRTIGPDSNGGFRAMLQDDVAVPLGFRHREYFDYIPGLATAWARSEDGKTFYIKLDPKATFSDGEPVTVDDFLFMFWFYRSPYVTAPWYNNFYSTMYTNITRYDDHTMSISIPASKPDGEARVLSLIPIAQHFYKEVGEDFVDRYQWRFAPTTGAYVIEDGDIKKGRSITMTRIPDWWAGDKKHWRYRFNADKIRFTVIRDTEKIFEAFRRGDLDQSGLNLAEHWYEKLPDDAPEVAAGYIKKAVFYNQRPRPTYGLWINTARPLLDNRDIRLGINHASNWQLVIDKFFRGDYARMRTEHDGFGEFTHPTLQAREFDIDKAQAHFSAAGFSERGPDGILVNAAGQRLSFTLSSGYQSLKDILTILKEEAAKAGLEFRIEVLDGTASWKKVQEKQHDIHFSAFGVFLEMYPRFWEHYHSDNAYDQAFLEDGSVNPDRKIKTQTNNLESFADPEMDVMIERYRASDDKEEMIALAHSMSELHHEHGSFVPGFFQGFYRVGYWRWVQYPEQFSYKHTQGASELFVHWIDEDIRQETLQARKSGKTFEPSIEIYDRWKEQ